MKKTLQLKLLLVLGFISSWSHAQIFKDTIYVASDGIDSYVYGAAGTTNYGTDTVMSVHWTGTRAMRTFLDVDLTGIPSNAIVLKTELKLNALIVNNAANHPMYVERVLSSWTETGITYSNQPKVTTAGRASITQAQTSSTGLQSMDITALGQFAVNHPEINYGWRISLQTESGATANGVVYASSEHGTSSKRPYVVVEYVLPIQLTATIKHCTNGMSNGTIDVTVDDGSGTYTAYTWYKYAAGTVTTVQSGSSISTIDIDSLADGLYLCTVTDNKGTTGYKYFLVGEYGTTTSVEFRNTSSTANSIAFNEDAQLSYTVSPADGTREGGSDATMNAYYSSTTYQSALLKYKVDFDSLFDITQADLRLISGGHYRNASPATTDSGYVARVTADWLEGTATWNTKPASTTSNRITINQTSPAGAVTRNDTLNILNFVEKWQEYPDSNFGIDLSLKKYTQSADAYLRYYSTDNSTASNRPGFALTYSLPEQLVTNFVDSLGTGTISLVAPNGELPYTYLISYDTLPVFDSIWYSVKDSIAIDSADFYHGRSNTHRFTYANLPNDHYFIGVYDNNGALIFSDDVYLTPTFEVFDSTDLTVSGDTLKVQSGQSSATATLFASLPIEESGGFEMEVISLGGDVVAGVDNIDDVFPTTNRDYLYAFDIKTSGKVYAMRSDTKLDSTTVSVGAILKLYKDENNVMHFYKNGIEFEKDTLSDTLTNDFKLQVQLKSSASKALFKGLSKGFKKPKLKYTVVQAECGDSEGSITITVPSNTFFAPTINSYSITDLSSTVVASGSTSATVNLGPGIYTLHYNFTIGSVSYPYQEQFIIGYKMIWTNLSNMTEYTSPYDYIKPTSLSSLGTAKSANTASQAYNNWIQFSTQGSSGTFALGYEQIQFKNAAGAYPFKLIIYEPGGGIISKFVYVYDQDSYVGEFIGGADPFRAHLSNTGTVDIYYSNALKYSFTTTVTGTLTVAVAEYNKVEIDKAIASFCYPSNPYVAKTKPVTDGSYFITIDDLLNFQYTGEYNQSDLIYELTDETGAVVSAANYTIDLTTGTGILKKNADNRYTLDMESLPGGFYLLTITNVKGEKHYLRIKN
ncbi:MAG: DNRLRE domain-containing protein [Bacteroidetes bacterium]|nr:DNRLRE domain-containing protein [Bacteroidota bacterium]